MIDIVVVVGIIVLAYFQSMKDVKEELGYFTGEISTLLYIGVVLFCMAPKIFLYSAYYFGVRLVIKRVQRRNLTYTVVEDIPYYREVLEGFTPYEISILANLSIEEKKDVVATILWYQNKKVIDIDHEKIIFFDNVLLDERDKFFIDYLKTRDLGYLDAYKNCSFEELKRKGYIQDNEERPNPFKETLKSIGFIFLSGILVVLLVLFHVFFVKSVLFKIFLILAVLSLEAFIIFKRLSILLSGYVYQNSRFSRTSLGEEKTEYIHALQNFIHDFGNFKHTSKEQLVLWEDFLTYAVVLEENDKIIEEIEDILESGETEKRLSRVKHLLD